MLSVDMNEFDTGMVGVLRISFLKRVASTRPTVQTLEWKALSWAQLLLSQRGRKLVFRVKFS